MALKHFRIFIKSNNHTNIILVNVPHRYDLMQPSFVNNEIRSINRKRKVYEHTNMHHSWKWVVIGSFLQITGYTLMA